MGSMTQLGHRAEQRARAEQAAFNKVVERVSAQFPELDHDAVVSAVRGEYGRFDASPIRDFLPILVERSVRYELARTNHRA
jgi:hypothetical protein